MVVVAKLRAFPIFYRCRKMKFGNLLDFRKARGRAVSLGGPGTLTLTTNLPKLCVRVAAGHRHDWVAEIPAS